MYSGNHSWQALRPLWNAKDWIWANHMQIPYPLYYSFSPLISISELTINFPCNFEELLTLYIFWTLMIIFCFQEDPCLIHPALESPQNSIYMPNFILTMFRIKWVDLANGFCRTKSLQLHFSFIFKCLFSSKSDMIYHISLTFQNKCY